MPGNPHRPLCGAELDYVIQWLVLIRQTPARLLAFTIITIVRCLDVVDEDLLVTVALDASFVRRFERFLSDVFTYVEEYHMYTPPSDI